MGVVTETTSAQLYRSGIKMVVEHIEVDEEERTWLEGSTNKDQEDLAERKVPKLMKEGDARGIVLYPDMGSLTFVISPFLCLFFVFKNFFFYPFLTLFFSSFTIFFTLNSFPHLFFLFVILFPLFHLLLY